MLDYYWECIPIGKGNAITYEQLCKLWDCDKRAVRNILHALSAYDNGDDYILIRTSSVKGFYKTNDKSDIEKYKRECISMALNTYVPVYKIKRVLSSKEN